MRGELLVLIVSMGAATYALRAGPLLLPLPNGWIERGTPYLRLVAPAVLSALAAISTLVALDGSRVALRLDGDGLAVIAGIGVVAWRGNLALGIGVGVVCALIVRSLYGGS